MDTGSWHLLEQYSTKNNAAQSHVSQLDGHQQVRLHSSVLRFRTLQSTLMDKVVPAGQTDTIKWLHSSILVYGTLRRIVICWIGQIKVMRNVGFTTRAACSTKLARNKSHDYLNHMKWMCSSSHFIFTGLAWGLKSWIDSSYFNTRWATKGHRSCQTDEPVMRLLA